MNNPNLYNDMNSRIFDNRPFVSQPNGQFGYRQNVAPKKTPTPVIVDEVVNINGVKTVALFDTDYYKAGTIVQIRVNRNAPHKYENGLFTSIDRTNCPDVMTGIITNTFDMCLWIEVFINNGRTVILITIHDIVNGSVVLNIINPGDVESARNTTSSNPEPNLDAFGAFNGI